MDPCLMDEMNNRKVITVDIPGIFLQGNWTQDKYPGYIMFEGRNKLTIEITKRTTVLIKSFRKKSGVHFVMSLRQILFVNKFKTPLYKMGELVMAHNVRANNKILQPRVFYALFIGPTDGGTGHLVFKLLT